MIIYLDPDIIRLIASNLEYNILDDLLNLSITCKYTNYALDNIFFQNIANQLYSSEFWSKAKLRPSITSKPLSTIKKELLRLEHFQDFVEMHNFQRWTITDFYNYWILCDYVKIS